MKDHELREREALIYRRPQVNLNSSHSEIMELMCWANEAADMLAADAQQVHGLSLNLLERLSKTLTNLGYSTPEGGIEHFGAQIDGQLYNLCRGVEGLLSKAQQRDLETLAMAIFALAVGDGHADVPPDAEEITEGLEVFAGELVYLAANPVPLAARVLREAIARRR